MRRGTWRAFAFLTWYLIGGLGVPDRAVARTVDTVTIAQGADISTGDPHRTGLTTDFNVLANVYEPLIGRDASLRFRPGLAVSWKALNPTTWEFRLRTGVRFHDGQPFNAAAVKFSLERGADPRLRWTRARLLAPIASITAPDSETVRISTKTPISEALFLQFLSVSSWIVPPDYLTKNGDEALVRKPVGTGPYRFVQWVKDDRVELAANPIYWGGRPAIGRVVVRAIPSESSRLAELLAGSVDLINLIPPQLFDPIQRSADVRLVQAPSLSIFFVHFNLVNIAKDRPLADKRVRQALNHAVDRTILLGSIMQNVGTPVATMCTSLQYGCDPTIAPIAYDPARARALLAEAGYASGFDVTLATPSGAYPGDRDLALAVAEQWTRVGLRVRPNIVEYGVLLKQMVAKKLEYDAVLTRATSFYANAGEIASSNFTSQGVPSQWSPANPEFERVLLEAQQALDETKAKERLARSQLLFKDEAPSVPLFTAPNAYGVSRDLQWTPRPDLLLLMAEAQWK